MRRHARASLPVLAALALALAGCGSSSSSSTSSTTVSQAPADTGGSGPTKHVVMRSLYFNPSVVDAKVGQRVVWNNQDYARHNVTYISGPQFTSSRVLSHGATFSIKLSQAGTIHYYCTIHPWMKATIVVSA